MECKILKTYDKDYGSQRVPKTQVSTRNGHYPTRNFALGYPNLIKKTITSFKIEVLSAQLSCNL